MILTTSTCVGKCPLFGVLIFVQVYPIYDEDTSKSIQPGTQEEFELKKLPLEEYVCSVRLWCCTVERNGKVSD